MSDLRVYIEPNYSVPDRGEGGIRRVVEAQFRYLPQFGIEPVKVIDRAQVSAGHGTELTRRPDMPFVSHCHGLHWTDYEWDNWAYEVNEKVTQSMTQAQAVTMPSKWVREAVVRGVLVNPTVIYHGVDADEWTPANVGEHGGYALWNKGRLDPISNALDMQQLARRMVSTQFVTTLGMQTQNVSVVGVMPLYEMKPIIQRAGVYLQTARETMGIGMLEAMASGVPVAGWNYGGQAEVIRQGETGYLAEYGDYEGLANCVRDCLANRERMSVACIEDVRAHWAWPDKIAQYAEIYHRVYAEWTAPRPKVSVIVPCHNLGRYLADCLNSVLRQRLQDWECLIIDDASDDNTAQIAGDYAASDERFKYHRTPSNLKLVGTLNYGAGLARGKYLINLDADNQLGENALSYLSMALDDDPARHIVYGMLDTIDENGLNRKRNSFPQTSPFDWRWQMGHLNQIPSTAMYRREVWARSGGWRERMWRAEDAEFWCRVTSFGFRAERVTDECALIYRMRSDSKSRHEPGDGDWTAWFPWRMGADNAQEGLKLIRQGPGVTRPKLVPFGAQGKRSPKEKLFWNVPHHTAPVVSVIIPLGPAHEKLVIDALDSLIAQDVLDWEVIVVNNTGRALAEIPGAPYARIIDSPKKQVGAARNAGVKAARGKLIYFLDADDFLNVGGLRAMLERYAKGDAGYIYSDYLEIGDNWSEKYTGLKDYDQHEWRAVHSVNILIAKSDFNKSGGFDGDMTGWEDWDLFSRLAILGICGAHLSAATWCYRKHTGTRRDDSLTKEAELLPLLKERYGAWYDGGAEMGSCCGGNPDSVLAAKKIVAEVMAMQGGSLGENAFVAPPAPTKQDTGLTPPITRMQFIGEQVGAITFFGKSGAHYRGGNNNLDRYVDALPGDVERLVNTGMWAVVPPPPAPEPEPQPVILTAPEPPMVATAPWLGVNEFVEAQPELVTVDAPAPGEIVAVKAKRGRRAKVK